MTPRERAHRALDHAIRLESARKAAALAAVDVVTPTTVAPTYARLARSLVDVAEAWEIAEDALEEAGDPNAGYARYQVQKARKRAVALGRIRLIVAVRTFDAEFRTPATLAEAVREIDSLRAWQIFRGRTAACRSRTRPGAFT